MGDEQPATGDTQGDDRPPLATGTATGTGDAGSAAATAPDRDLAAELAKWKHLARQNEAAAKANAEAAKKLAAIEDSQKTEQQRNAEKLAAAERRAAQAELKVLRSDVAAAKGVPAALAHRLHGTTREEIEADADALLEAVPRNGTAAPPPVETPNSGTAGGDPRQLLAAMISGGRT